MPNESGTYDRETRSGEFTLSVDAPFEVETIAQLIRLATAGYVSHTGAATFIHAWAKKALQGERRQ